MSATNQASSSIADPAIPGQIAPMESADSPGREVRAEERDAKRGQAFLLARATLIVTTAYMILAQTGFSRISGGIVTLIVLGIVSCVVGFRLPVRWLESSAVTAAILIGDTAWITALLVSSGRFEPEFFYLYFFVLFLAAIGERMGLIALGTVVVCAAYLYAISRSGHGRGFDVSSLIRLPFLFAVATFYGYLVDRVRRERTRAREEAASVRRLEEVRRRLESANETLEREVRERRRAEEQVRKLSRAVEQSPAVVIITDTDGVVEYVNPRFCAVTGLAAEEVGGRSLRRLPITAPRDGEGSVSLVPAGAQPWQGEVRYRGPDGEPLWMSTWISPLRDPAGRHTHFIVVQEDVTDRKQAEMALHDANRELARVSELKSSFVSIVSHELRTPLTSIRNALDLVSSQRTGRLETDQKRFLEMALRNLDRLGLIIDDLLDLSKIEAGRLEYRFSPVPVGDLLDEAMVTFAAQAAAADVDLVLEVEEGLPPLLADGGRLSQVLSNLVGNALKFTDAGGRVTLVGRRQDDSVLLEVVDTGAGIRAEELERIFEPFHQAEDCLTRSVRGTGLGLSVARELVWAHGGELTASSAPGRGSRFSVSLPVDAGLAGELVEMEEALRRQRQFPFSALLAICWHDADGTAVLRRDECRRSVLLAVRDTLRESLPKQTDLVLVQPAHNRVVVVLPSTPRAGAETVRHRLERLLGERAIQVDGAPVPPPSVVGPAVYPEDGLTARALVNSLRTDARPAATPEECTEPSEATQWAGTGPANRLPMTKEDGDDRPQSDQDLGGGRRAGRGGDGAVQASPGGVRRGDRSGRSRSPGYGALVST